MTWHYNMRQHFYRLLTIWYICRHDSKCKPVVCSFDRLVFVWHATFAGGEGGFWIWARAFLGPVCIILDPIDSGWGDLAVNCSTPHLFEEHANQRPTTILHYDQWSPPVQFSRHVHITDITVSLPCLTHFVVPCAQMFTSRIRIRLDIVIYIHAKWKSYMSKFINP